MLAAYLILLTGVASFNSNGLAEEKNDTESIKIGLLLPVGYSLDPVDSAAFRGATLAIEEANVLAGFFGKSFELVVRSIGNAAEAGVKARQAVEDDGVVALIGNLDLEEFVAACSVAQQTESVLMNCRVKSELQRTDSSPYSFHIESGRRDYLRALAEYLVREEELRSWFLVRSDDAEGKDLEESVERILSEVGGDLVGTTALSVNAVSHEIELEPMRSSGSDLILMGLRGDRQAAYVERYSNSDFSEPLAIVDPAAATLARLDGGALAVDVYWPVMWHHSLFRYSARELNSRHLKRFNVPMDGESWSNWTAVKIVSEAVIRSQSTDPKFLLHYLESQPPFDGHKGASLTFDLHRRQLSHTLYVLKKESSRDQDAVVAAKVVFRHRM